MWDTYCTAGLQREFARHITCLTAPLRQVEEARAKQTAVAWAEMAAAWAEMAAAWAEAARAKATRGLRRHLH